MIDSNAHIDHDLAAKYLAGECKDSELEQFEAWLKSSSSNKAEFDLLKSIWDIDYTEPGAVDVDKAWNKVITKAQIEDQPIVRAHSPFSFLSIAASIVLFIGVSTAFWFVNQDADKVFSTTNELANIVLDDGTVVSLSPNTTLTYPEEFDGNLREVSMVGKAFFNVAKNSAQPFIIHTDGGDVTVVGTAFEVNTEDQQHALIVEVEEGIVDVASAQTKEVARVTAGKICKVSKTNEKIEVSEMENPASLYWKDKTIKFKRTQLDQVVKTLKEVLNLDIKLQSPNILHCELTVVFTNETPETIIEIIALTLRLEVSKQGSTYIFTGDGC